MFFIFHTVEPAFTAPTNACVMKQHIPRMHSRAKFVEGISVEATSSKDMRVVFISLGWKPNGSINESERKVQT